MTGDERCSDPYGLGCTNVNSGFMRGVRINEQFEFVEVTIYLCNDCCYWECDHDYEMNPEGPILPRRR